MKYISLFCVVLLVLSAGHPAAFVCAVLIHETGHLLGARLAGAPLREVSVSPSGLGMHFPVQGLSYPREALILVSGSLLGLATTFVTPLADNEAYRVYALGLNLANLLPLPGLDGGALLRCLLHLFLDGDRADRITKTVYAVTSVLFWTAGAWIALRASPNVTWLLCGTAAVLKSMREL